MKNGLLSKAKKAVKYWWVSLIIGLLAIALGIWCILTPDSTLVALTMIFIISFFVGGILEIIFAVSNRKIISGWGWTLTGGIIDLLFGIFLLIFPLPIISVILVYFIGFWIMFRSVWGIGTSVDLERAGVRGWGWMLALAILGVLFSIMFLFSPIYGASFIVAFASIAFVAYGVMRIYFAFKIKSLHNHLEKVEDILEEIENID
ncbi:DUF308 domain-containing protein [Bacteroidales bacterium OttesenSCG-928-I21]|nr:DUF308 domain-containing protein [Bacteroidales bacterium OttesenSCG-928-I21]